MTSGVYAIVNVASGMTYVGSSRNVDQRWKMWRYALNGRRAENKNLQSDWLSVEGRGFQFVLLQETEPDRTSLIAAEGRWMQHFRGASVGLYNVRLSHVGHGARWFERRQPRTGEHDG